MTAGRAEDRPPLRPVWPTLSSALQGTVSEFDDHRGLGTVVDEAGTSYPFHCTAISDGSRSVEAGTEVTFSVRAGHLGRVEACSISPRR